jgi:hypothetical protein
VLECLYAAVSAMNDAMSDDRSARGRNAWTATIVYTPAAMSECWKSPDPSPIRCATRSGCSIEGIGVV